MRQCVIDFAALGQVIDKTWGRSSTKQAVGSSITFKMQERTLIATYQAIVNFGTERERIMMRRRCIEEASGAIDAAIKCVRESYRAATNNALKLNCLNKQDCFEMLGGSPFNPKRTALCKYIIVYELI